MLPSSGSQAFEYERMQPIDRPYSPPAIIRAAINLWKDADWMMVFIVAMTATGVGFGVWGLIFSILAGPEEKTKADAIYRATTEGPDVLRQILEEIKLLRLEMKQVAAGKL